MIVLGARRGNLVVNLLKEKYRFLKVFIIQYVCSYCIIENHMYPKADAVLCKPNANTVDRTQKASRRQA